MGAGGGRPRQGGHYVTAYGTASRSARAVTPRRLAPPPPGRTLNLRMTLLVVVLGAAAYAGALPLYLLFRVSRPALALGAASEAITALNAQLMRRGSAPHQTLRNVHPLARAASPRPPSLALPRHLVLAR